MLTAFLENIIPAFYPELCLLCETENRLPENEFCLECMLNIPYTDHFENPENALVRHFWGRVPVVAGAALFDFRKEHAVRTLIHRFKYQKEKNIGIKLGMIAGLKYLESSFFKNIDVVIPVPSSRFKMWKRGFNQAEIFALGIHRVTHLPLDTQNLKKCRNTKTQTKKTRVDRLNNVMGSFRLKDKNSFEGKHVLIVDDVLTTGATIESCINAFSHCTNIKFSVLTIGLTSG
jgi:ComF family protein